VAGGVRGRGLSAGAAAGPHAAAAPRAWVTLAAVLGALAVVETVGGWMARDSAAWTSSLDWQPSLAALQPWRAWTAAGVHWSAMHLAGNLVATALVAWLGVRARAGRAETLAWAVAWPLTHALFAAVDAYASARLAEHLPHYGGLSGVLHAGVAILALAMLVRRGAEPRREREQLVGGALLAGLFAKVLFEAPWKLALRPDVMLGIGVAPVAHAAGLVAGLAAGAAVVAVVRVRARDVAG
jgi:membrane associated rhomboid family serine protease